MGIKPSSSAIIPPTVPDSQVPSEIVATSTASRRKASRDGRFLKGPIPLSWIRDYIKAPADRLLLVLRAHSDMQHSVEMKVTADILRDAKVTDRKMAYRALKALELAGVLEVRQRKGCRPVIRLKT